MIALKHSCYSPPAHREIGGKDPRDLAVDSSGTRSYAAFLVELSHLIPDSVLQCVSVLLPHLNGESYTFRNGVLGVIGELLLYLHGTSLDDQGRQLRDQLFSKLEEHIHDSNAFVRVKVLQLLMQLITSQVEKVKSIAGITVLLCGTLIGSSSPAGPCGRGTGSRKAQGQEQFSKKECPSAVVCLAYTQPLLRKGQFWVVICC